MMENACNAKRPSPSALILAGAAVLSVPQPVFDATTGCKWDLQIPPGMPGEGKVEKGRSLKRDGKYHVASNGQRYIRVKGGLRKVEAEPCA